MIRFDGHSNAESNAHEESTQKHRDGSMIPLINMTFLLLLFFIVAGSFYETFAKEILPPHSLSDTSASSMIEEFVLMPDGELQWRGETTTVAQWFSSFQTTEAVLPSVVRVRADADTPAALVIPMLDDFKQVGVKRVSLVTVKAEF